MSPRRGASAEVSLIRLDFSSLCKLFPDENHRWIARFPGNRETELTAHPQHRLVLAQYLPYEFSNAALASDVNQARHQQISDAAPLPVAADGDGIFRAQIVGIGKEMRHT